MKSLKVLASAVVLVTLASPVFAQQATKNVVVDATLTSACRFTTSTDLTLTAVYPAFSATAVAPSGTATVECTRGGSTPTLTFDSTLGVVGGLVFQLAGVWTAGAAGTAPAGAAIGDVGTARTGSYAVTATFPAGQAGTSGATTPVTKVMTVTF